MNGGGLSVLLVAESFFIRHYFSCLFEKRHDLWLASSGEEAIEKTGGGFTEAKTGLRCFDIIFINEYLPDIGVTELLEKIGRCQPEAKSFVLLTNSSDANRLIERHGAAGIIIKPFTTGDI